MVHGDCSSSGCYAMTDEQMGEIYALGREALLGGQRSFQVQAYPFRMTALNMAKHRNSPNMAFWRMIKEGSDHFEVTRQEPKVDVCEKHYVFDAVAPGGASTPLNFNPKGKCPAYEVSQEVASAIAERHAQDEREFAELVSRGTATVAARTGNDGGMNPIFAAKLTPAEQFDSDGRIVRVAGSTPGAGPAMPATIVNPPKNLAGDGSTGAVANAAAPARMASADPSSPRQGDGGAMINLFGAKDSGKGPGEASAGPLDQVGSTMSGWFGLRGSKKEAAAPAPTPAKTSTAVNAKPAKPVAPPPKPMLASTHSVPAQLTGPRGASQSPQQSAPGTGAQKPPAGLPSSATALAPTDPANAATSPSPMMAGAQPIRPSGSFENRWGGM
jgi:hypothetical protein